MVRVAGTEAAISHRDRISNLTAVMRNFSPPSRRDKLLGEISSQNSGIPDPGGDFREEDIFDMDVSGRQTPPPPPPPPLPKNADGGNFRRSLLHGVAGGGGDGGLGLSSLSRGAASSSHLLPRVESSSRMIPQSVASSNSSSSISSSSNSMSRMIMQSAPVNVPDWSRLRNHRGDSGNHGSNNEEFEDDDADSDEERLPPHILAARSQSTTFSVFEGAGRTLKGRDLSRTRNKVLKQTGFL